HERENKKETDPEGLPRRKDTYKEADQQKRKTEAQGWKRRNKPAQWPSEKASGFLEAEKDPVVARQKLLQTGIRQEGDSREASVGDGSFPIVTVARSSFPCGEVESISMHPGQVREDILKAIF
ncbi:UNVERIFIED_CONTAM: hypothetical protein K2H54_064194, partial [Gekko kuhli]